MVSPQPSKSRPAARAKSTPADAASGRRRTQDERSAETRARILVAAAGLIRSRGYARLRTADVANAAGVSRAQCCITFPPRARWSSRHWRTHSRRRGL